MGFDAFGATAYAELPAALVAASTTTGRPMLVPGLQPRAVVVLLDITARGVSVLALALILSVVA